MASHDHMVKLFLPTAGSIIGNYSFNLQDGDYLLKIVSARYVDHSCNFQLSSAAISNNKISNLVKQYQSYIQLHFLKQLQSSDRCRVKQAAI